MNWTSNAKPDVKARLHFVKQGMISLKLDPLNSDKETFRVAGCVVLVRH